MSAILAHAHCLVFGFQLLPFGSENLDNQCRNSEEKPLERNPPPTDAKPPKAATVFRHQLSFCHGLDTNICAVAFWASHLLFLPSNLCALGTKPFYSHSTEKSICFLQQEREG
jgi:hypothetical protein